MAALGDRLRTLLADPVTAAGSWSVEVRSLRTAETLFAADAERLLTPASTLKTITLAVAADRLGWDYTYQTSVVPVGEIRDGVLHGDLVVVGSGDPSLDDWDGVASRVFQSWATSLKARGITTVTGRIIGDDHAFGDDGLGTGWMWDDMAFYYSAAASGLQFNEGYAQLTITPGAAAGAPATVALSPPFAPVPFVSQVTTGAAGALPSISLQQHARTASVRLTGSVPAGGAPYITTVSVTNPTLYFVRAVRESLGANGIEVGGDAVDADDVPDAPAADAASAAIVYRSPPLTVLGDTLMKLSQNMYAESFLRSLGVWASGTGTADAGRVVVNTVLASWGIPPAKLLVADGSGLSRYNLVSADALVRVLSHVYADERLREPFTATLPVAGVAGTLSGRMKGTPAEGNVRAKTGSFTNARAAAGFVTTADGEPLAFAVMVNNYGVPMGEVDRVTDAVLVALAGFRR